MPTGTPTQVRVGPGWLYIGAIGTPEPDDVLTELDEGWVNLGYTDGGTTFTFDQTFEDITVDQENDPVAVLQTQRSIGIAVQAAEITASNLEKAFNGGTITGPDGGVTTFEPPDTGDYTHVMLLWVAMDELERWLFRKCLQVGSVAVNRQKAPDKTVIPLDFRAIKPDGAAAFKAIFDSDFASGS